MGIFGNGIGEDMLTGLNLDGDWMTFAGERGGAAGNDLELAEVEVGHGIVDGFGQMDGAGLLGENPATMQPAAKRFERHVLGAVEVSHVQILTNSASMMG